MKNWRRNSRQPLFRQPLFRQPLFRQPLFRQPLFRQRPFRQRPFRQRPFRQRPFRQRPFRQRLSIERLEARNLLTAAFGKFDFNLNFDVNAPIGDPADGLSIVGQAQLSGSLTPLNSADLSQLSAGAFEALLTGDIVRSGSGVVGRFSSDAPRPVLTAVGGNDGVVQLAAEQTGEFQADLLSGAVSGVFSMILGGSLDFVSAPAQFNGAVTLELDSSELSDLLVFDLTDLVAPTQPSILPTLDPGLSSLADFVWTDVNGDGIQQPGEPGRANVLVQLVDTVNGAPDGDDVIVASGRTDFNGGYAFVNIDPGAYYLKLGGLFFGLNVAAPNQGADAARDSDFLRDQLRSPVFVLDAAPQHLQSVDAGIVAGSPYQNVFNPLNVNRDSEDLVTTEDLLDIVTDLVLNGARDLDASPLKPLSDVDVDGNAIADTLDLLLVLEVLLLNAGGGEGEGAWRLAATRRPDANRAAIEQQSAGPIDRGPDDRGAGAESLWLLEQGSPSPATPKTRVLSRVAGEALWGDFVWLDDLLAPR